MINELALVLVADDPLVRGGIAALLGDEIEVVRAVATDADLSPLVATTGAEAMLWDAEDPITDRRRLDVGVPTLVLARDADRAAQALGAGAQGVLQRDVESDALTAALLAVRSGLQVVDPRFEGLLRAAPPPGEETVEPLTPRETEVLEHLAEGRSNREIALALDISPHTAKFHVDRILLKLDASGRTDAVVRAVRLGLLRL
ncbi:MAG: response regulator transcription factor [Myxococcota bacterium]